MIFDSKISAGTLYIDFIVAFIICFKTIFSFLSNMDPFIQLYLSVFFARAEKMASVYDEIDVKDEPLFPSLECDQVCSVFFMTLMFIIDLIYLPNLYLV